MGQLTNLYVSQSYQGLIKLANSTTGVTNTLQYTQDGLGNNLPIQISTSSVNITGSFTVNGQPISVDSGSLVTTASFNAYTSSNDSKVNSLISATGSYATTSSLTTLSGSIATTDLGQDNRLGSLETATGSLQNQINQKLDTGSFNSYTSSNDSKVNSLIASTGSYATTSSLTSLSQSIALTDLNQNNTIAGLATTSSVNTKLDTGSFNSYTSSNDGKVNSLISATGSYATTGSNNFVGQQNINNSVNITGSLNVTGEITALSASITYLETIYQTSSIIFSSGSNILGDEASDTQTLWGRVEIPTGPVSVTGSVIATNFTGSLQGTASFASNIDKTGLITTGSVSSTQTITGSVILTGPVRITGSLTVTGSVTAQSITGSLQGTASYATQALSASFANNAVSSSFSQNTISGSFSNFAVSSSYAQTASFASNGGVTQILAGPNIIVSPLSGQGQVTISSTGTGTGSFNTATGSYGSFYDTTTQVNPVANTPNSMSFNETAITNGVSISGSLSPFNTYIKTQNAGVYNIQFSAQVEKTDSGTDEIDIWIRKNGIDLVDTATKLTLQNNNTKVVAAWNWFVQSATNDYYQLIWASADTDMRLLAEASSSVHPGIPSVIATANRVDQFLSNTGSFNGDFNGSFTGSLQGTASFATNALSASYAPMPDVSYFATTGSNIFRGNQTISGSLITNTLNDGLIKITTEAQSSSSLAIPFGYISASAPVSQSNLIFGTSTGIGGVGQLANNQTGSIVISGSNNIILAGGNRTSTLAQGTYGYVNGSLNFVNVYPTLTTSSILRPSINNNNINSTVSLAFTTSSLGQPQFSNNNVQNTITIDHQSGSLNYTQNINVGPVTSTANNITLPFLTTLQGNYFGGSALTLNHNSSSITALNNIIGGGAFTVTNLVSSSLAATNNGLGFSNNIVVGQANGVWVSGSNITNRRNITSNIIGGVNTAVSASQVGAQAHLYGTIVYGQNLIVSASHAINNGGSAFLGRYNDASTLNDSQQIVFAVGTGTAVGTRRTGLYVTSGSLVGVSGSLDVKGNTTITGSVTLSGSAGPELIVIGDSEVTGTLKVTVGITGSLQGTASYATNALTASFALNGGGGGSTDTGSLMTTGSVAGNVLTFTKGDGSTFDLTVATGSGGGSAFPFTGSAVITGSLAITGSASGNVNALSISSNTASLNLNDGNFFTLQLVSGSATHINPSNIKPGQTVNIRINTTGSATVNFPSSVDQVSGSSYVPTTTTGVDIITLVSFDSSTLYLANVKNLV
jgi:hypothetical protein